MNAKDQMWIIYLHREITEQGWKIERSGEALMLSPPEEMRKFLRLVEDSRFYGGTSIQEAYQFISGWGMCFNTLRLTNQLKNLRPDQLLTKEEQDELPKEHE